ncbi:MAG TPA: nuclear transport factor 2 family protein [Bryobacteraceae bacterium]|jgi:predicted SnoaL-like aldol condensation-catalyzing enzyme|nr:nuclear transport factor 2 family protein [Bryobacteraceae bacterium]
MKSHVLFARLLTAVVLSAPLFAQTPVTGVPDPESLTKSSDKKLEANKTMIYNLFREVLEARHMELADKYLADDFIQHNPNAADGLAALKQYFANNNIKPQPIAPKLKRKITAIIAEGDMVMVIYPRELKDPKNPSKTYTTAGFDAYRIKNGKVVEHWDAATKSE